MPGLQLAAPALRDRVQGGNVPLADLCDEVVAWYPGPRPFMLLSLGYRIGRRFCGFPRRSETRAEGI